MPRIRGIHFSKEETIKNYIINSRFDVWQRGISLPGLQALSDQYNADRWVRASNGSGGTINVSRQEFILGQTDVPNNPRYFFRYNQSVAQTGATVESIRQAIEDVTRLANKWITISFWAKADAARVVSIRFDQNFGSGGSPSSLVVTNAGSANLTTAWQKFTFTIFSPSIAGKTLGTTAGSSFSTLVFLMPVNTISTIDIADVVVNEGKFAEQISLYGGSFDGELASCQRYCLRIGTGGGTQSGVGQARGTTSNRAVFPLPVLMRSVTPVLTTVGTPGVLNAAGSAQATTGNTFFSSDGLNVAISQTVAAGLVAGNATTIEFGANDYYLLNADFTGV